MSSFRKFIPVTIKPALICSAIKHAKQIVTIHLMILFQATDIRGHFFFKVPSYIYS